MLNILPRRRPAAALGPGGTAWPARDGPLRQISPLREMPPIQSPVIFFLNAESVPWPTAPGRRRTCLARSFPPGLAEQAEQRGLDPDQAVDLLVQRRKDGARLEPGDRVWVAPVGRTPRRHVRTEPYAVIRAADGRIFWAMGSPMPGRGW
jgi:hypothetical protein